MGKGTDAMNLAALIKDLDVHVAHGDPASVRVCDITEDSRTVVTGSLFVARPGTQDDGSKYIAEAERAGASAILTTPESAATISPARAVVLTSDQLPLDAALLAERFYGNPGSKLTLVGVTGTNGKTTVAHLVRHLLRASGRRCGLIGTVEIDDGCERAEATMTTPPAIEISRTLATMVESGCDCAVVEVSSHALAQRRVGALSFKAAVFTNLTGDHQDYHGSMEEYASAKAMLFESLAQDAVAIINADDPHAERMVRGCAAPVIHCGNGADASVTLADTYMFGSRLDLVGAWGAITARTKFLGEHNATNTLQAVAVAHALGVDDTTLASALPGAHPPTGRLEPVESDADVHVLVDFAHTDDALASALGAARSAMPDGASLWAVFGAGGEKDQTKRPRMGAVATKLADRVVITSDNPRREEPHTIISQIRDGIDAGNHHRVRVDADREHAIRGAIREASPGDVIVLAGKGHEREQELPDGLGGVRVVPFDEVGIARSALAERIAAQQDES